MRFDSNEKETISVDKKLETDNEAKIDKKEDLNNNYKRYKRKKTLIVSIVFGIICFIIGISSCFLVEDKSNLLEGIGGTFILTYIVVAIIYCLCTDTYINDVFLYIATKTIRFPGIIFTWSLSGFRFLILMKLFFAFISIFFGIFVFFLALFISIALSFFSFIPILISHIEEGF